MDSPHKKVPLIYFSRKCSPYKIYYKLIKIRIYPKGGVNMANKAMSINLRLLDSEKPHLSNSEIEKRKKNENALKVAKNKLKAPSWLSDEGKQAFEYVVQETESIDLLNNLDLHSLAIYSNTYSEYIKVSEAIREDGILIYDGEGIGRPHPLYSKQKHLLEACRVMMSDLGLSPSARAKLAMKMNEAERPERESDRFDV